MEVDLNLNKIYFPSNQFNKKHKFKIAAFVQNDALIQNNIFVDYQYLQKNNLISDQSKLQKE